MPKKTTKEDQQPISKSEAKRLDVMQSAAMEQQPKHKALSVAKINGEWKVVTYEVQGDKILNTSYSEGGNRALALERFKITSAKEFFIGK